MIQGSPLRNNAPNSPLWGDVGLLVLSQRNSSTGLLSWSGPQTLFLLFFSFHFFLYSNVRVLRRTFLPGFYFRVKNCEKIEQKVQVFLNFKFSFFFNFFNFQLISLIQINFLKFPQNVDQISTKLGRNSLLLCV